MYIYNFAVGDIIGDGHGKFQEFRIESNKTKEEVQLAEEKIEGLFGFSPYNILKELEDNVLEQEYYDKLIELGFEPDEDFDREYIFPKELVCIWKFMVEKADPKLKITICERPEQLNSGEIGYGLFL